MQAFRADAAETGVMLRSLLFAPGDSEKKMGKAAGIGADCIILDLEDSVAVAQKPAARQLVHDFLQTERTPGVAYYVRVNPMDSGMVLDDLAAVMPARPDGIIMPKAEGASDTAVMNHYLDALEKAHGTDAGHTGLIPIATETAAAVFRLGEYQQVAERLRGITWGAEDLAAAVSASTNLDQNKGWTGPFETVRSLCLFGAHAAGVQAIDTVMADFRDGERLRVVCEDARRDGFSGKICIHPAQVPIINETFSPSDEEVAHARAVMQAFADNPDAGALQIEGQMIDRPHQIQAARIIALADSLAARA